MSLKAQVGVEYLMVFGFALVITLPVIYYFFIYSEGPATETNTQQALLVARRVVDNAEVVYSLGEGTRTTLRAYVPNTVISSMVTNNEVVFRVAGSAGTSDVVYPSSVNINGTLPNSTGVYYIHFEAFEDYVNISYS